MLASSTTTPPTRLIGCSRSWPGSNSQGAEPLDSVLGGRMLPGVLPASISAARLGFGTFRRLPCETWSSRTTAHVEATSGTTPRGSSLVSGTGAGARSVHRAKGARSRCGDARVEVEEDPWLKSDAAAEYLGCHASASTTSCAPVTFRASERRASCLFFRRSTLDAYRTRPLVLLHRARPSQAHQRSR